MKKILFIKPNYRKSKQTWAINHFHKEIKSFGYKSYLLTGGEEIRTDDSIFYGYNTDTIKIPLIGTISSILIIIKAIKLVDPEIIHINNHIGALTCILISKLLCRKCFISLDMRTPPPSKSKIQYYKIISNLVDNIFALNNEILESYNNKSKRLLPLGYNEKVFYPIKEQKSRNVKTFIYYGSLDKVRCLHNMINAFKNLKISGHDFRVTIIGNGNAKTELITQVRNLKLSSQIIFIDKFLSQKELAHYISKSDIGISYIPIIDIFNPNLPLKTVELLACGIPVCATATKGNKSIISDGENGLLSSDSSQDFTDCLKKSFKTEFNMDVKILHNLTWNMITKEHLVKFYNKI